MYDLDADVLVTPALLRRLAAQMEVGESPTLEGAVNSTGERLIVTLIHREEDGK
jgi:hypothetical protein